LAGKKANLGGGYLFRYRSMLRCAPVIGYLLSVIGYRLSVIRQ